MCALKKLETIKNNYNNYYYSQQIYILYMIIEFVKNDYIINNYLVRDLSFNN